jgi:hypothetical protein
MNVNFSNVNQLFALRTALLGELAKQEGQLTFSEKAALEEQLWQMCAAPDAAAAQGAFNSFNEMLPAMSSNSFRVETLTQKGGAAASVQVEQGLRNDLTQLNERVDYLSQFGGPGGTAFLTQAQTDLLRGYLERAESRLQFYADPGDGALGLTASEAAEVRNALSGTAEPGDPAAGAGSLITQVLAAARLNGANVQFGNVDQLFALRTTLLGELAAQGGRLTRSENSVLEEQLSQMTMAPDAAAAQRAFNGFRAGLAAMRGNSFKVETLTQKGDEAASVQVEQGLRNDLVQLNARVDYLSQFGGPNGTAFLTQGETNLLRGYLERAESRLQFYANPGDGALGLTASEASEVRNALTGIAEPGDPAAGAVNLIARVLAQN